ELISRINRAKPRPIGRSDVPQSLESLLTKSMSRKPDQRPVSVMEFVRGLQSIETELGAAQTSVEVAVDEWALATVADHGDRTRVRAAAEARPLNESRSRRRRVPTQSGSAPIEVQYGNSGQSPASRISHGRGARALAWSLIITA